MKQLNRDKHGSSIRSTTATTSRNKAVSALGVVCVVLVVSLSNVAISTLNLKKTASSTSMTPPGHYFKYDYNKKMASAAGVAAMMPSNYPKYKCLQTHDEIDKLVAAASQVFITMPAKASGSTMKQFTKLCLQREIPDNFLNSEDRTKDFLTSSLELPKFMSSHLYVDTTLRRLVSQLPTTTLLVYIHRNERYRLVSAIKHVFTREHKTSKFKYCDISLNTTHCMITEKALVSVIEKRVFEIKNADSSILSCDAYNDIDKNAPNMVFMHYMQSDRLQRILAKYHCPDFFEKREPVHVNVGMTKEKLHTYVTLKTHNNTKGEETNQVVSLEEWVQAKADWLQLALGLQQPQQCQGKTREMERELLQCPTEVIHA